MKCLWLLAVLAQGDWLLVARLEQNSVARRKKVGDFHPSICPTCVGKLADTSINNLMTSGVVKLELVRQATLPCRLLPSVIFFDVGIGNFDSLAHRPAGGFSLSEREALAGIFSPSYSSFNVTTNNTIASSNTPVTSPPIVSSNFSIKDRATCNFGVDFGYGETAYAWVFDDVCVHANPCTDLMLISVWLPSAATAPADATLASLLRPYYDYLLGGGICLALLLLCCVGGCILYHVRKFRRKKAKKQAKQAAALESVLALRSLQVLSASRSAASLLLSEPSEPTTGGGVPGASLLPLEETPRFSFPLPTPSTPPFKGTKTPPYQKTTLPSAVIKTILPLTPIQLEPPNNNNNDDSKGDDSPPPPLPLRFDLANAFDIQASSSSSAAPTPLTPSTLLSGGGLASPAMSGLGGPSASAPPSALAISPSAASPMPFPPPRSARSARHARSCSSPDFSQIRFNRQPSPRCRSLSPAPPIVFSSGSTPYVVERVLGKGHFGTAYLVTDEVNHYVLKTQSIVNTETQRNDALKEALPLATLPPSPHLLTTRDFFFEGSVFCIVINYCSGGSLQEQTPQRLPPDEIFRILCEIATGLSIIHGHGFIHRDIKPDNLFLADTKERTVVIGDMGLARRVDSDGYYANSFGHNLYKAPEVNKTTKGGQCGKWSKRSDMWAVGCVGLDLLSGQSMEERCTEQNVILGMKNDVDINTIIEAAASSCPFHPVVKMIKALLRCDPHRRLSAEQVLEYKVAVEANPNADPPINFHARVKSFSQLPTLPEAAEGTSPPSFPEDSPSLPPPSPKKSPKVAPRRFSFKAADISLSAARETVGSRADDGAPEEFSPLLTPVFYSAK